MKFIHNFNLKDDESVNFLSENRAFQYGDGLFESMIMKGDEVKYLEDHLIRLKSGMKVLKMIWESDFNYDIILGLVKKLAKANTLDGQDCRIKLQVWRKSGGLYTPKHSSIDFLMSIKPFLQPESFLKEKVAFSQEVTLNYTPFSRFKNCNAIPYVLAGIERKERQLDDLVLKDNYGNISECCSANIFWRSGENWYTPSLETGCVEGIMRKEVLGRMKKKSININEGKFGEEYLLKAKQVFACNVTGYYPIKRIEGKEFDVHLPEYLKF